jgi:hypothetical protein
MATAHYTIHKQKEQGATEWGVYLTDGTWAAITRNGTPVVYSSLEDALAAITAFNTGTSNAYNVITYYTSA